MHHSTATLSASALAVCLAMAAVLPVRAEQDASPTPELAQAPLRLPTAGDAAAALSGQVAVPALEPSPALTLAIPVVAEAPRPAPAELALPAIVPPASPILPVVEAPPAPVIRPVEDLIVLAIRERLAQSAPRLSPQEREDRQALAAFYADRKDGPVWVGPSGLSARGLAVAGEIARADDWGLVASAFDLPDLRTAGSALQQQRADEEFRISMAVLKYARHARGGRLEPTQLSRHWDVRPPVLPAADVIAGIAAATAPDAYLRGLHPRHSQFQLLRQALLDARGGKPEAKPKPTEPDLSVRVPDGPSLKPGEEHDSVSALRQRLGTPADQAADSGSYDTKVAEAVRTFQKAQGIKPTGTLDKATRTALNAGHVKPSTGNRVQTLVANMERWRWLPADMGELHIWDNIAEYQGRVLDKGRTIHQFRIIVGKPETPTPVFSADMRTVVFQPGWGVPDSIKVKELLPYLRRSSGGFFGGGETDVSVLRRHNLNVSHNGRPVDARSIDWQQVDIRRFQFIQPPGASNVLGQVKFLFPNKHDVYMHDTSQRSLFAQSRRTYSHGCVRVDNPRRLAEIIMERDRGMPAAEVGRLMTGGPQDNNIHLTRRIPVHVTYFTAVAEADGSIKTHPDIYGHDARLTAALAGRPMAIEPAPELTVAARVAKPVPRPVKQATQSNDFFAGLFGN